MTKITYIPGEIANAAIDEQGNRKPVTRTQHIFDDAKDKSQAEVNKDVDDKFTQLDNEIEGLEKQDVIPVDTLPDVSDADPKKIYRVVGETSYTDYMVNATGDGWKELATFEFPGIDDDPTAGSDDLVKSGGVYAMKKKMAYTSMVVGEIRENVVFDVEEKVTIEQGGTTTQNNIIVSFTVRNINLSPIFLFDYTTDGSYYQPAINSNLYDVNKKVSITIPQLKMLVCSLVNGVTDYRVVSYNELLSTDVILLTNLYGSPMSGALMLQAMKVLEKKDITALDTKFTQTSRNINAYQNIYLFRKPSIVWHGHDATVTIETPSNGNVGYYLDESTDLVYFKNTNDETSKSYSVPRLSMLVIDTNNKIQVKTYDNYLNTDIVLYYNANGTILTSVGVIAEVAKNYAISDNINHLYVKTTDNTNIIARLGYDVYSDYTPPQQSIAGYKLAIKKGYKMLLADVRWTSDDIPVCCHDDDISKVDAYDGDTKVPSGTVYISGTTYDDLQNYDFGRYKGDEYIGTKILSLYQFLRLCKMSNVIPILEAKQHQNDLSYIQYLYRRCKDFGLEKIAYYGADYDVSQSLFDNISTAGFVNAWVLGGSNNAPLTQQVVTEIAGYNKGNIQNYFAYLSPWQYADIFDDIAACGETARNNNVKLGLSECSLSQLNTLISNDIIKYLDYLAVTNIDDYFNLF